MKNFVLIYTGVYTDGSGMPEDEAERAKIMSAWGAWYEKLGAAIVDGGNPFGEIKHVDAEGTGDGAVSSPAPNGYTIISAASRDDAVAKVQDHPHVTFGGQVSVFETFEM